MNERKVVSISFDGTEVPGTFVESDQPLACALLIHGITANREEWGFYTRLAAFLDTQRISSLRIDYRCHGELRHMPMTDLSLAGVLSDVDAAAETLGELVPDTPTLIFGVSFGGGLAATWGAINAEIVAQVYLCSPVLDYLADIASSAGDWRPQLAQANLINYNENMLSRSLVNEARWFDVPGMVRQSGVRITILHGGSDTDVPISRSEEFVAMTPNSELITIPGAEHGFVVPGDFDAVTPETHQNYDTVFRAVGERLPRSDG